MLKKTFTGLLLLIVFSTFAQTSNKKRVLVVPPSRFEFASKFSLEEIAEKNETTASNIFLMYEKALLNTFQKYKDENFEFVPVDAETLKPYKNSIKYKYRKFKGKHYNAVDLTNCDLTDFTKLLEKHHADFVAFITWYEIKKEVFTRKVKQGKRMSYAAHFLDFDIYNLFKQQVAGVGKVKAKTDMPNDLELPFKLLRIKELESGYNHFIGKVVEELNKPIKN